MKQLTAMLLITSISLLLPSQQNKFSANKQAALASIEKHRTELIKLSDQVWAFAETAAAMQVILAALVTKEWYMLHRKNGEVWKAMLPEGPPPVPKEF